MARLIDADNLINAIRGVTLNFKEMWKRVTIDIIENQPTIELNQWIPVSERVPETNDAVNITFVNHNPHSYYADIKDKPFVATGHYHKGKWWWYSSVCKDYLDEYDKCTPDMMDIDIEVIAWMPLPDKYEKEVEE